MLKNKKGVLRSIRKSRFFRLTAVLLAMNLVSEMLMPTVSYALTEGPSQPEVQSFEPINTTQMVNVFSGDFNYNIPLFNLPGPNGGYPVNLAYHAGVTVDDEASWTGLGWNINVGSLVRSMRGLPDEFQSVLKDANATYEANENYDYVEIQQDMKRSWTLGVGGNYKTELFGAEDDNFFASASVYYNNYNGLGLQLGATYNVNDILSLGLTQDSENGLGLNASLSLSKENENVKNSLSLTFDGKLSVDYALRSRNDKAVNKKTRELGVRTGTLGNSITFARSNFSPSVGRRVNEYNFQVGLFGGVEATGFFESFGFHLFYNTQDLNDDLKKGVKSVALGYAREGAVDLGLSVIKDFTRSGDGQITKSNMFLPYAQYNFDTYTSTGQGLSGFFRSHRSDIGKMHDPYTRNLVMGANVSGEIGAGAGVKFGVDGGANFGWNTQGPWDANNSLQHNFESPDASGPTENLYYQVHGEQTILDDAEMAHIGGTGLGLVQLAPRQSDNLAGGKRAIQASTLTQDFRTVSDRKVRNTLIHTLQNSEVTHLGEFDVKYFQAGESVYGQPAHALNRSIREGVNIGRHPAGYKVLNESGAYYVYGLPAYNVEDEECLFSVEHPTSTNPSNIQMVATETSFDYKKSGTDKFINRTRKSPYAHSYLLTSVQGADYVDIANDGPTDDDLGYWVKFNYRQQSNDFGWRAPFTGNNYSQGQLFNLKDDKASYSYGRKELWYLGQIETKTHIAVFVTSGRKDFREAAGAYTTTGTGSENALKLDAIKIYTKEAFLADGSNAVPLQEIHFVYEDGANSLCKGIPDVSPGEQGRGKLTLKQVYFTSQGSDRGSKSRYEFEYAAPNADPNIEALNNPNYGLNLTDPWGSYKPMVQYEHHSHFPYVNQFNQDWQYAWKPLYGNNLADVSAEKKTQAYQDALVSAWALKKIKLPSGGEINIQYESDDYAYVQHKTAAQMFKIEKLGDFTEPDEIYNNGSESFYDDDPDALNDEARRRIYFKLEKPIPVSLGFDAASARVYQDYVAPLIKDENGQRNLYFKTKMRLTNSVHDYIRGYLPLEEYPKIHIDDSTNHYNVAVASSYTANLEWKDGVTEPCYTYGFVTVQAAKKKNGDYFEDYHPMALAGWTYMQTSAQELLNDPGSLSTEGNYTEKNKLLNKLGDLVNMVSSTAANFGRIRKYCKRKNYARFIDLEYSCIRLASPDKKKFGGGHRVKQITITDNWSDMTSGESHTYGQVFDYTIEENGKTISSGVAQYEPQLGGDENALKYPIYYFDKQTTFTNNNLFAEAPLNEGLFPGAMVGYRRVSVKSLNTDTQMKVAEQEREGRTGGVTVHSFYTAKEFPTLTSHSLLAEENNTKDIFNLIIPIPLIGSIKRNYYHGTQAYLVELNDMHGRPKAVESFELNDYELNPNPITSVVYEYQMKPISYQGEQVFKPDNEVKVIPNDGSHQPEANTHTMGVEYDFFTDQREAKTFSNSGALDFNVDVVFLPALSVWPTYNNHKTLFRTYVTNKVIERTGILKRTIARDLQTSTESEIIAYDEKSGTPVLTKMKNEYGDDFYSYNIPAYYEYERMGHAYQNINFGFQTTIASMNDLAHNTYGFSVSPTILDNLVRGDEVIITLGESSDLYKKGYFLGWEYGDGSSGQGTGPVQGIIYFADGLTNENQEVSMKVIRSGYRNHYNAMAGNYLTKGELNYGNPQSPNTTQVTTSPLDQSTITTKLLTENTVLSATAVLYKDDWLTADLRGIEENVRVENPFLTGNSGIWRPYKSYTYVGTRKGPANLTADDPELYSDGVFEEAVPMFSWKIGNLEEYVNNWEWTSEKTKFSWDSYELENVNRIGIYSSAIYGYDNSLTIGVAGNANSSEIGVTDFETTASTVKYGQLLDQTNLNFFNTTLASDYSAVFTKHYTILYATYTGADLEMTIDIPYSQYLAAGSYGLEETMGVTLNSSQNLGQAGNKDFYFNAGLKRDVSPVEVIIDGQSCTKIKCRVDLGNPTIGDRLLPGSTEYTGKVSLLFSRDNLTQSPGGNGFELVQFVSAKAHTGKRSMLVPADADFDQLKLFLEKDKKYVASFWISRGNTDVFTFKEGSQDPIVLNKVVGTTHSAITNAKYTYGKVIEDWQKVDIEFSLDTEGALLSIEFVTSGQLYVDDIRIAPKTGGITTYVYDPVKKWLRASLNVDNYATLYFYDEEGNLTIKKQETERGIYTITESRGHVREKDFN